MKILIPGLIFLFLTMIEDEVRVSSSMGYLNCYKSDAG